MTVLTGSSKPCPSECLLPPSTVAALTPMVLVVRDTDSSESPYFQTTRKFAVSAVKLVTGYGMGLREGLPRQPGCYCNDDITQQHFSVHPTFAL